MSLSKVDLTMPMVQMPDLPGEYAALALKAEQDVLGLAILHGSMASVDISPGWFSSYRHLTIFYALAAAEEDHSRIDLVTVIEILDHAGRLEEIGGLSYLATIVKQCPDIQVWQLTPLLHGFALMRYNMTPKNEKKVIVRLDDAVWSGWLHGKAWLTTQEQLDAKNAKNLCDLPDGMLGWVCYAYLDSHAK